ncbi:AMP deaminase, partial [Basidiobolus ranarum]
MKNSDTQSIENTDTDESLFSNDETMNPNSPFYGYHAEKALKHEDSKIIAHQVKITEEEPAPVRRTSCDGP